MTNRATTPFTTRTTAFDILDGINLHGRHALVTGGGSGLGLVTARALANAGAEVTVAVRKPRQASDVPALEGIGQVQLDLADLGSVQRLVSAWQDPLDVLVANAGIMAIPTRQVTPEGWELHLATNFLGHFALATGLHRHLAAAAATRDEARLVIVSSGAHRSAPLDVDDPQFERRDYDRWSAYGQSKTADVLLAVGADRHWSDDGILANALNPGFINTGLQRYVDDETMRALGAMDEEGILIEADYYKTPEQGASTTALLAGSPLVAGVSGRYFEDNQEAPVMDEGDRGVAPHALDAATADWLWDHAAQVVAPAS
jgi:NAD(P)-dependent dehydrogenase (short-subunit alcohol dehydrogenase family)